MQDFIDARNNELIINMLHVMEVLVAYGFYWREEYVVKSVSLLMKILGC